MICLGIESTAHTFGAGIITDKGKVLANVNSNYFPKEGVHPTKASEHHSQVAYSVIKESLEKAKLKEKDIDLVAFSQGPGLPPCLRVGAIVSRTLALKLNKPLTGVNHCISHIEIGTLKTKAKDPITLYVSGGNSQVIGFAGGKYRVFGESLDIAIGNAIDKFARECDLGFPGGPAIEKIARKGKYVELPYTVKGMDFSFSGVTTELIRRYRTKKYKIEDLCFSFQENCFSMLTEVVERALAHTEKNEVLLTGGVAANSRLQSMLEKMCKERGARFYVVPREWAGDNGTMIAWTGILAYKSGEKQELKETNINQKWRVDDVLVKWI